MTEVLSQKEIDELLAAINAEDTNSAKQKLYTIPGKDGALTEEEIDALLASVGAVPLSPAIPEDKKNNNAESAMTEIKYAGDIVNVTSHTKSAISEPGKDGPLTDDEITALLAGADYSNSAPRAKRKSALPQTNNAFEEQYTNWPETIPQEGSLSWRGFVNCYYKLVETVLHYSIKARREGLLALEEGLAASESEDFFKEGLLLVAEADVTDAKIIRHILTTTMEREHDFYKKKLIGIAIEGILDIQRGDLPSQIVFHLNSMVAIKDNPIDAAWEKFLSGDKEAFFNIDFKSAIQPEEEREEVRFVKRAVAICEIARKEGLADIGSHLDKDAIAARDVFEYGLSLFVDGVSAYIWMESGPKYIAGVLSKMVERETDPVQKNLALAKKEAVLSISAGDKPKVLARKILAYFDRSVAKAIKQA